MATTESIRMANYRPIRTQSPRGTSRIREHYLVKSGDTLSGILREHLASTGRKSSPQAVYQAVKEVARTNQISNPDLILVGQRIDLNIAAPRSIDSFDDTLKGVGKNNVLAKKRPETPGNTKPGFSPFSQVLNGAATLTSPFGMRKHPIQHKYLHHNGIDIAAVRNTPITPMRSGTVTYSGWKAGHGNTIIIRHQDGLETQYSHAAKRLVRVGDRVSAQSVVGLVGDTGQATGPHLHMEVKQYGRFVNPLPFISLKK